MKTSKMLELVENLKVGEKVIIEKFKDHLFIDKKSLPTEWIPAPSDNINKRGVDLSILNEEDWFYLELEFESKNNWIAKGNIIDINNADCIHYDCEGNFVYKSGYLCDKDDITLLRKATPEDLAPFFEKYPQYAPVKDGDIGLFYDKKDGELNLSRVEGINEFKPYPFSTKYSHYKHFFKVHESETIAEIKERFLREVEK